MSIRNGLEAAYEVTKNFCVVLLAGRPELETFLLEYLSDVRLARISNIHSDIGMLPSIPICVEIPGSGGS